MNPWCHITTYNPLFLRSVICKLLLEETRGSTIGALGFGASHKTFSAKQWIFKLSGNPDFYLAYILKFYVRIPFLKFEHHYQVTLLLSIG